MTNKLNIAISQTNFIVGDLEGNKQKIITAHKAAHKKHTDLLIFSEMALTGYPPEDLVTRLDFQAQTIAIIHELANITKNNTAILLGSLWQETPPNIYNAAILLDEGSIKHITCKYNLPNYGVFDEKRLFTTPPEPQPIEYKNIKLGVMICEDMWNLETSKSLQEQGAQILISINASPFELDKPDQRTTTAKQNVTSTSLPLIYTNQIGGQDELIFDGGSFIMNADTSLAIQPQTWQENIKYSQWQQTDNQWQCTTQEKSSFKSDNLYNTHQALKLGLHDYITKNNFPGVVIGMSGGIDSALTAAIAVETLGSDKVHLIMMPSKYTSSESINDAEQCAKLLNTNLDTISIEELVTSFHNTLAPTFHNQKPDTTEENIQSRIRGDLLMAISNKFGYMVLTTGNKSELAVGYATLYGDMCGGYNILKDIYKTDVFALANYINSQNPIIPNNIITKPPTAELRPNQQDNDSLPPYDILDDILKQLIELRYSSTQIIQRGYDPKTVNQVAHLTKLSEYKRHQAPPGVKITNLAFGKDHRYPITNGYNF